MKTERIISVAALLLAALSCQVRETMEGDVSVMTFYATREPGTRTQLGDNGWGRTIVCWSPSDEISIYCKGVEGKFISSNTEVTGETVEFIGSLPVTDRGESPFWAVYPYSDDRNCDGKTVEVTLPSEQKAVAENIEEGLMVSMARSTDHNLYFRHLFGIIQIGVFEKDIKKVVLKGNGGESLAGRVRAAFDGEGLPVISEFKSVSQEITLLPPDGGETFQTGVPYYVVCFPGSFESGYTLEFYREELVSMKKIDTPVKLSRGAMVPLFDLYSGGIISSTESNGKSYSVRYKVGRENGRDMAEYWVTVDDKVIPIPGKFEVSVNVSPTRKGPAVAIDTETETVYFAMVNEDWETPVNGYVYKVTSSGYEEKHPVVGYYPYFRFDESQKRVELYSFGPVLADGSCEYRISYHDSDGEWVKRVTMDSFVDYGASGHYRKTLSDIICLFHEPAPSEPRKTELNLGLSVNWADCNLGAAAPERYGDYYAWGETVSKKDYSLTGYRYYGGEYHVWNNPVHCTLIDNAYNAVPIFTKYNHVDKKTILDPEDDAAHTQWGGHWRMPTPDEWRELIDNCTWETTTVNGVVGQKGTSLKNGVTIFFPGACYRDEDGFHEEYPGMTVYHSSYTDREWCLSDRTDLSYLVGTESAYIDSEYSETGYGDRWRGLPVRPVYDYIPIEVVTLDESRLELIPRDTARLTLTISPVNATNKAVVWTSSDESVATVSQAGEIKSLTEGTATITVTALEGGMSASCRVVVKYLDAPEIVDLGLSVKWASFNLGAARPEDTGYYYAWGETKPKEDYGWDAYKWHGDVTVFSLTKYCLDPKFGFNGFADYRKDLEPEDDAACVNYGGKWRMPSEQEVKELLEKTKCTPARLNGVNGCWLTSTVNGNRIFLPLTGYRDNESLQSSENGYYWSSTIYSGYDWNAQCLSFRGDACLDYSGREYGLPVRAVYDDSVHSGGNEGITPGGDINM